MVQVPVSTQRRVQTQAEPRQRFNYAEARDFMSPAIQQVGQALQGAAEDFDRIEATYDEADVLNLDNMYAAEVAATKSEFGNLRGDQPGRELKDRLDAIDKRAEELVSGARSERAKTMARRTLTVRSANARAALTSHADAEMFRFRDGALAAGRDQALNDAIGAAGTPQFDLAIGTGLTRIEERGRLNGAPAEAIQLEASKFLDGVHGGVVDAMFAVPDPSVDDIMGYVEAYSKDMTPALRNKVVERLQGPLQGRVARSDADTVMGLMTEAAPAEPGKAPPLALPGGPQGVVGAELQKAGFSGAVVAGFLGNFDVEGGYGGARGDGGKAAGIAQWHPDRQANFRRVIGKDVGSASHAEQARFVVWEMKNPAAAGMSKAQRDAILNASTPGEAAELIDKHYERSSGQHRANRKAAAEKYGGGSYSNSPREWDRSQIYANLAEVAEREGWNPERIERARGEIDKRVAKDEGLLREEQGINPRCAPARQRARLSATASPRALLKARWRRCRSRVWAR